MKKCCGSIIYNGGRGGVLKMQFSCMGGLQNAIFCMGVSKTGKILPPSPFLNGIALRPFPAMLR